MALKPTPGKNKNIAAAADALANELADKSYVGTEQVKEKPVRKSLYMPQSLADALDDIVRSNIYHRTGPTNFNALVTEALEEYIRKHKA